MSMASGERKEHVPRKVAVLAAGDSKLAERSYNMDQGVFIKDNIAINATGVFMKDNPKAFTVSCAPPSDKLPQGICVEMRGCVASHPPLGSVLPVFSGGVDYGRHCGPRFIELCAARYSQTDWNTSCFEGTSCVGWCACGVQSFTGAWWIAGVERA